MAIAVLFVVATLVLSYGKETKGFFGKKKNILRVATFYKMDTILPFNRMVMNGSINGLVYDPLTMYDENGDLQPMLAESWEWNSDQTELTLHIRRGVKFHTGRELTAKDIIWNLEELKKPDTVTQMKGDAQRIVEINSPDEYTVVLKFSDPTLNFFDTAEGLNIVDPESYEQILNGGNPVGTGPFKVEEWIPDNKMVLSAVEDYWQEGKPYLDGVEVMIVPDQEAMVMNLEAGAVDMVVNPTIQTLKRLSDDKRYNVILSQNEAPRFVAVPNTQEPPLDNKLVRQAINYAIPRQRFVDTITKGMATAVCLPWSSNSLAYDEETNTRYTHDLDKARELLAQAGINPEDWTLTITYKTSIFELKQFAVLFQDSLSKLGFKLEMIPVEIAEYRSRNRSREYGHILIGNHSTHNLLPTSLLTQIRSYKIDGAGTGFFNLEEYNNLVKMAHVELDLEKRQGYYKKINAIMLEHSFVLPFSNGIFSWVATDKISGLRYNKFETIRYEDMQKEK